MPPRKTVQRLEDLCYSHVAKRIFSLIALWYQKHNGRKTKPRTCAYEKSKELQQYLKNDLPSTFRERILEDTLNMISKSMSDPQQINIGRITLEQINFYLKYTLKCLFINGITYLDLTPIAHLIDKLENVTKSRVSFFTEILEHPDLSLTTLKYLKLPHFVSDEFITLVGANCKELEYLILNCSFDCNAQTIDNEMPVGGTLCHLYTQEVQYVYINQKGFSSMIAVFDDKENQDCVQKDRSNVGCKKLKQLILPDNIEIYFTEDVSNHGKMFLTHMKDLEHLVGIPMVNLSNVYESILNSGQSEHKMCDKIEMIKLNNFYHGVSMQYIQSNVQDTPFTPQLLSVFKDVKEISISTRADITEVVLKSFPYVKNVTLLSEEFNMHRPYLNNLVKIDIHIGNQEEWPILKHLCISSPKLEDLTFRSFSFNVIDNDIVLTSIELPELNTLRLIGQFVIHPNSLNKFLSGCPSLTSLFISMRHRPIRTSGNKELEKFMNDSVLLSIIPLIPNLEEFCFKLRSS